MSVLTFSCEILAANHHPDPFHGMPTVCYNGQYQHDYILQYLNEFQKSRSEKGELFNVVYYYFIDFMHNWQRK